MPNVLAFDIGGTKIAWGIIDDTGKVTDKATFPTPESKEKLVLEISDVIKKFRSQIDAVGYGYPGPIEVATGRILHSMSHPDHGGLELTAWTKETYSLPAATDNDARCALIGEVWLGAAQDTTSAVMITIGTGVGGAVMQKGQVLPAAKSVQEEISHLVADSSDPFPGTSRPGTVEALIGGKSIEMRFGINLGETAKKVRAKDEEAVEIWQTISYYFLQSVRAIYDTYSCKKIIIGGKGVADLDYYLQDEPPCPVVPAVLGAEAGIYGAARLALDAYEVQKREEEDDEWS